MHAVQGNDISMLHDMAQYLANQGAANDGRHNPIPHLFWWAWNSNSADTGGLVTSPNWDQVQLRPSLHSKRLMCVRQVLPGDAVHCHPRFLFWWAWNSDSAINGGLVTSPDWDQVPS